MGLKATIKAEKNTESDKSVQIHLNTSNNLKAKVKDERQPEKYAGPYEVVPDIDSQELATKDRLMTDNMVIQKIPYYEVSNTSGGKTIYIRRDTNE